MNIFYLSQARLPSSAANSVHVNKMCDALAKQKHNVTLLGYKGNSDYDIYEYYSTTPNYTIKTFDLAEKAGESIWLAVKTFAWLFSRRQSIDLIYSRSAICLFAALALRKPFIYEVHSIPRTKLHCFMERKILKHKHLQTLVVISQQLKNWYLSEFSFLQENRIRVLPDASDPTDPNVIAATLPGNAISKVGYVGHLYPGKGGELIIEIAHEVPEVDFHLVGGRNEDIARLTALKPPSNVFFHGHVPYKQTKSYLIAFDIVLAPYSEEVNLAKTDVDIGQWMSPLKIFEYMSAGKAIIASDLPVLKEVLCHENNCLLANPRSTASWTEAIDKLLNENSLKEDISKNAFAHFCQYYTWESRAQQVTQVLHGDELVLRKAR